VVGENERGVLDTSGIGINLISNRRAA